MLVSENPFRKVSPDFQPYLQQIGRGQSPPIHLKSLSQQFLQKILFTKVYNSFRFKILRPLQQNLEMVIFGELYIIFVCF